MKVCRYCGIEQPEANFEIAVVVKDKAYRRRKCQACKNTQQKQRTHKTVSWVREYKKGLCCERCGFSDYRALEFHHRNPTEKEFHIGDFAIHGGSIEKIKREIEKCNVLCANCHRIEHFIENNGM